MFFFKKLKIPKIFENFSNLFQIRQFNLFNSISLNIFSPDDAENGEISTLNKIKNLFVILIILTNLKKTNYYKSNKINKFLFKFLIIEKIY